MQRFPKIFINDTVACNYHRANVAASRGRIAPIPDGLKVNSQILMGLTNEQFIKTFRDLQKFFIVYYEDIEYNPIAWGYPDPCEPYLPKDCKYIGPHDTRLTQLLFAFIKSGQIKNGTLIIDSNDFCKHINRWGYGKPELMIDGIMRMGFTVENFIKESGAFTVSYPKNPHIMQVLCAYFTDRPCPRCYGTCSVMGRCYWDCPVTPVTVFSYRFIEDPAEQKHETEFLAFVSGMPKNLQEIQYFLYSESKRYGYRFNKFDPVWAGGLLYEKGALDWPRVGIISDAWHEDDYRNFRFMAHVKFNRVFKTHTDKIAAFAEKRPDVFYNTDPDDVCNSHCGQTLNEPCPSHRVTYELNGVTYHNCGGFRINNPTLEDVKAILELYKLENNINPV